MKATTHTATTAANAFAGYAKAPTSLQVTHALGQSHALWKQLLTELKRDFRLRTAEWNTSAPKRGWSLRIKQGERIIVYLTVEHQGFHACFVLGDRARQAAMADDLPSSVLQLLRNAKRCAAGTGIRVPVETADDIAAVKKLAAAKLQGRAGEP